MLGFPATSGLESCDKLRSLMKGRLQRVCTGRCTFVGASWQVEERKCLASGSLALTFHLLFCVSEQVSFIGIS